MLRVTYFSYLISGAITNETTDINLIKMFNEGPLVSLKGSPTVSPTTAALLPLASFSPT